MKPTPKNFTGDDPLVGPLNRMIENISDRTPLESEDIAVEAGLRGFRLKLKKQPEIPEAGSEVEQFRVHAIHRDHLDCQKAIWRTSDGKWDIDAEIVRVAKPETLRMMNWDTTEKSVIPEIDGYTYHYIAGGSSPVPSDNPNVERDADLESADEFLTGAVRFREFVWPKYIADRTIIYAAKVKQSVLKVPITVLGETSESDVEWVDLNTDGRLWLPQYRKIRICIEGQAGAWFILVRASNGFQEA